MSEPLRIAIRPIPEPLWGRNLRKVLRGDGWKKLRAQFLTGRKQLCDCCGVELIDFGAMQVHERWILDDTHRPAVATLTGLELLCERCHWVEHFLLLQTLVSMDRVRQEQLDDVVAHFCRLNEMDSRGFGKHLKQAEKKWVRLSEREWRVDWGPFAAEVRKAQDARFRNGAGLLLRPKSEVSANPADDERQELFVGGLQALSRQTGYWIGRSARRGAVPLHIRQPGVDASPYGIEISETIHLGKPDAAREYSLGLKWTDDPIDTVVAKKSTSAKKKRRKRR